MSQSLAISEWVQCDDFNNDNPKACKGWLRTPDRSVYNCDAFCASIGYVCYEAYKEDEQTSACSVRAGNEVSCSGPDDDDYVCGCELAASNTNSFKFHSL